MSASGERISLSNWPRELPRPSAAVSLQALDLLTAEKLVSKSPMPAIELKAIPTSDAKLAPLSDLSAEQLKEMQERAPATLAICKQMHDLLTSSNGQSGVIGETQRQQLQILGQKLKSDIDFFYDSTHNFEQPAISDPSLSNNDSLANTLTNHWQSAVKYTSQARQMNETLERLLNGKAQDATSPGKLKSAVEQITTSIQQLAHPLSNLRTNCFTKIEIAEYEAVEKLREGIREWGLNPRELEPYNKQHELLKPYFAMTNTFLDALALCGKPGLEGQFAEKLAKFNALFNDPQIRALETSEDIAPAIRSQLKDFAHMQALSKYPGKRPKADDLECMRTPAIEIQGSEFALKVKARFGARWKTYSVVDEIPSTVKGI